MINREKSTLATTTQVVVGRQRTQTHRSMPALPQADAIDVCDDSESPGGANWQVKIEETVHAERLAGLIHGNSSVCHDLRHYLCVLVANIEFLYKADSADLDRDDIYREIKIASEQMTDLIDSLHALGSDSATIKPVLANLEQTVKRALDAVKSRHFLPGRAIRVVTRGAMGGKFDARKLERVFFNLVLNACEATTTKGNITVEIVSDREQFRIRICDDGSGVLVGIRDTLFEPAVSAAKSNGRGFGLAVVKKIIDDHEGSVEVESTSELGTVILVKLPRVHPNSSPADGDRPTV